MKPINQASFLSVLAVENPMAVMAERNPIVCNKSKAGVLRPIFDMMGFSFFGGKTPNAFLVPGKNIIPPRMVFFPKPSSLIGRFFFLVFVVVPVALSSYAHKRISAFFGAKSLSPVGLVAKMRGALFARLINTTSAFVVRRNPFHSPAHRLYLFWGSFYAQIPSSGNSLLEHGLICFKSIFSHVFSDRSSRVIEHNPYLRSAEFLHEIKLMNLISGRFGSHGDYMRTSVNTWQHQ